MTARRALVAVVLLVIGFVLGVLAVSTGMIPLVGTF